MANLKGYSLTMKDETELHVRLLNDIDDDVSRATDGLASEGSRAAQVRKLAARRVLVRWPDTRECLSVVLRLPSRATT